jgi:hypothetical protein
VNHASSRKDGQTGGHTQSASQRSAAAKRGWETRRANAH